MTPILWTYYTPKSGLYPVKIRVTETTAGKTKVSYLETGIKIEKRQFSKGVIKNHPQAHELNLRLLTMCSKKPESRTFQDFFHDHMNRPHSYYHKKKLKNVQKIISDCTFPDLQYIMRLEQRLISEGKHANYIADIMIRIKTIINFMVKSGALEYHKNPFHHFKVKTIKTEKDRLTLEELQSLEAVKLTGQRELARDMYLVSYYQGGIRFGDLCRLKEENFVARLHYTMHKTGREKNIILHPKVKEIMKKYNYSFPLGVDWTNEDQSINSKNALMNKHLKAACRSAGIKEVSFHTSRHSITDLAVKKGLSSKQIQGLLGHGKLSTTESYLQSFYKEETDHGLEKLFS